MEVSIPRSTHPWFWVRWTWNQWVGCFFLIVLGGLNLIWPVPTLILIISLLVLGLFFVRPYAALIIAIFLIGIECVNIQYTILEYTWAYGIFYPMAVLGFFCWCVARAAGIVQPYQSTSLDLPLAIFWFSGVIALIWTPYWNDGIHLIIWCTMSYCFYLLISALNTTPRQVERLFWLWFALGNMTIITTVATFFFAYKGNLQIYDHLYFGITILQYKGLRTSLSGTMNVAKAIACVLNMAIFFSLALLCTRVHRWSRVLIFLSILGMLFIHFLTLSRLEAMGLFFGWLTFVYLNPQWRQKRLRQHLWMLVSVVAVAMALIAMLYSFYNLNELLARALSEEHLRAGYRFSGAQGRIDHFIHGLTGIWETGGLGAGANGIMRSIDPKMFVQSPSLYFSFLTDHGYGLLSLILMGWIMINLILELRWALQNCPDPGYRMFVAAICGALMVFATAGIGDHIYYIYEMWVLLGIAVAVVKGVRYLKSSPSATSNLP